MLNPPDEILYDILTMRRDREEAMAIRDLDLEEVELVRQQFAEFLEPEGLMKK